MYSTDILLALLVIATTFYLGFSIGKKSGFKKGIRETENK